MKRDRDVDYRKESPLRRAEAQHRGEQALAENRLNMALNWDRIETRRHRIEEDWQNVEADWHDVALGKSVLRQEESVLRDNELRLQAHDFKERVKMSQRHIERSLCKTESDFPGMRKLRGQYIKTALRSLEKDHDRLIGLNNIKKVKFWLQDLVQRKRTVRPHFSNRVGMMDGIDVDLRTLVFCFFMFHLSKFLLFLPIEIFGGPITSGMNFQRCVVYLMSGYLTIGSDRLWDRITEGFINRRKERCMSYIQEKVGCVTQVELKEHSKEVYMIRACRIMQEARPALQEALEGVKANRQRLVMVMHQPKDLPYSKEPLRSICEALRPVQKALSPLLPLITSIDDQLISNQRWNQSCISEAHRIVDKFWDSKIISCLFPRGCIQKAKSELVEKTYHLISKKSGLFPIEKELLLRLEEIDQAISEADCLREVALCPVKEAQKRMCKTGKKQGLLSQNNPTSLQKRCVEIIYLHGLDHGLDCDVQNQIDELFQDVAMPAAQEMTNLNNYVFMGWANPAKQ